MTGTKLSDAPPRDSGRPVHCSFCGKSQHDVKKIVAGPPKVFICDECVDLCSWIVRDPDDTKFAIYVFSVRYQELWNAMGVTGTKILETAFGVTLKGTPYENLSEREMRTRLEDTVSSLLYESLGLKEIDDQIKQVEGKLTGLQEKRKKKLLEEHKDD